jgi:hypothetical protein
VTRAVAPAGGAAGAPAAGAACDGAAALDAASTAAEAVRGAPPCFVRLLVFFLLGCPSFFSNPAFASFSTQREPHHICSAPPSPFDGSCKLGASDLALRPQDGGGERGTQQRRGGMLALLASPAGRGGTGGGGS